MATVDRVIVNGEERPIEIEADKAKYSNQNAGGVSNVKDALDALFEGAGGSGGGSIVIDSGAPYFNNPSLPVWKDNLKVLFIGNSYTLYSITEAMPTIMNNLQIGQNEVRLSYMHMQESTLKGWLDEFVANHETEPQNQTTRGAEMQIYYNTSTSMWVSRNAGGGMGTGKICNTVKNTAWDVIIFQVYPQTASSGERANNYASFKDTIKSFIYEIRKVCPNPNVAFGFHMIWPMSKTDTSRSANIATWNAICNATKQLAIDAGVKIIVPSGTVLMDAASTNTFKGEDHTFLVRDDRGHPAHGVASYILSCAIWESIFAPVFGKSMYGLTQLPPYDGDASNVADIEVTASNILLCQKVAMAAVCDMYNVTDDIDPIVTE